MQATAEGIVIAGTQSVNALFTTCAWSFTSGACLYADAATQAQWPSVNVWKGVDHYPCQAGEVGFECPVASFPRWDESCVGINIGKPELQAVRGCLNLSTGVLYMPEYREGQGGKCTSRIVKGAG